jgi:two-component system NtrC family sensor kinase
MSAMATMDPMDDVDAPDGVAARVPCRGFDAELALGDLFDAAGIAQWEAWLSAVARHAVHIVAPGTAAAAQPHAVLLQHELEPLLVLVARPPAPLAPELVALFEAHVRERIRYRLASTLQRDASARDWQALQASEARYRALAGQLEQRVQAQVADLQRARVYAFQAEQQRAVAQLAAGMAHEINNPIGFVAANLRSAQGYLAELRDAGAAAGDPALLEDFEALLQESVQGAARVAAIVAHLRVFSQVDAGAIGVVRPRALADAAVALLAGEVPAGVQVSVSGDPAPWACEAAAVSQAVFQLLRNALQAMAGRAGAVHLRLHDSGAGRVVEVQDGGCGMDPAVQARACDPFYSTRAVGQGVGLGLSVAAEVARRHGGRLELQSQPGQGTRVLLQLGTGDGRPL